MRCGFIGLGHIGKFLAGSLVRNGFEVTVFDLNAEAGKPLVDPLRSWLLAALRHQPAYPPLP